MPLVFQQTPISNCTVALWRIEEDAEWFNERLQLNEIDHAEMLSIKVQSKLLQFLASRYVLRVLLDSDEEHVMQKDVHGKPSLWNNNWHISLSHCAGYAAAAVSGEHHVGIDVEVIHPRVRRIVSKYLIDEELLLIGGNSATDESLITAWAMKEAVYKANGKKGISLKDQIRLPVNHTHALLLSNDNDPKAFQITVTRFDNAVLAVAAL